MRRTALALAALSLPLIAAPARAGVVEVTPSSPWNVDFAENKCRLARFFGEGKTGTCCSSSSTGPMPGSD